MRKKMREWLAKALSNAQNGSGKKFEEKIDVLLKGGLISQKDAAEIRKGPKDPAKPTIGPSRFMYWNVHLDGLERTHDLIVEREGVFKECVLAIRMAKALGYQVATNTTVYRETDVNEIEQLFRFLATLGVDGHTISPGYDYDAAKRDMVARLGRDPGEFFLTRDGTREKFARAIEWGREFPILGTPGYLEFLAGQRELACSAWAIPTRNIRGWKGPCYLMTDGHYRTYAELLEKTDWYPLAAEQGNLEAMWDVCHMLLDGEGGPPDVERGLRYMRTMARHRKWSYGGESSAELLLIYQRNGDYGLVPDPVLIAEWEQR